MVIIRPFLSDWATFQFKRFAVNNITLYSISDSELLFLQKNLYVPGAASLCQDHLGNSLVGLKAGERFTGGLYELVPQGLLDPSETFENALERELLEETGLSFNNLDCNQPTHMCWGEAYGDFMVVSRLRIKSGEEDKIQLSEEHDSLAFKTPDEIQSLNRYLLNPVSVHILESAGLRDK
ncbi:MAG: NUDIX domain-containing protein [archaeon]|nr:NUDIX domain-containing protein [archaeon]